MLGLLALLVAGCGEAEIIPAPGHDLGEPWQAQPFAVDQALVLAAERICRDGEREMFPAGLPLILVDARGDNRLLLFFAGPADTGECFVTRDGAGRLTFDGGGGTGGDIRPAVGLTEIRLPGAGSSDVPGKPWSYGIGQAGVAIASVELTPPSGVTVQASLNRGWFAAWWFGLDHDAVIVVRGYDALGTLVGSSP